MAESSYSLPIRHFELAHCVRFLESKNSPEQLEHPAVTRYKTFITSGPDTELLRFQSWLRDHEVKKILMYLRNFKICDVPDCERISNPLLYPTSELMVAELVTMISTKDPHAFWYFVHSLKTFQGRNGLFELFHGNINCCVCEEVQAKEKEIVLYLPEANETAFGLLKLWGEKIADRQLIPQLKRAVEGKLAEDIKTKIKSRRRTLQMGLHGLRKEVGPPLRELGQSFASFVKNTIGSKDSPLSAGEISNEKREDEIQPLPVVIPIPNEQHEQLKEDSESSCTEDDNEPMVQDEEAGHKRPTKTKSKFRAHLEASVSTFDVVEGRKKYIAFVFVSFFTLYSYVDSFIKLIPI